MFPNVTLGPPPPRCTAYANQEGCLFISPDGTLSISPQVVTEGQDAALSFNPTGKGAAVDWGRSCAGNTCWLGFSQASWSNNPHVPPNAASTTATVVSGCQNGDASCTVQCGSGSSPGTFWLQESVATFDSSLGNSYLTGVAIADGVNEFNAVLDDLDRLSPGFGSGALSIGIKGTDRAGGDMVIRIASCPTKHPSHAVCFTFLDFDAGTGIQVPRLGQSLTFSGAHPVYVYGSNGAYTKLPASSHSHALVLQSAVYMWVP